MKISGFQVTKYRNIIDSGWITVNDIAAFVGQNECGKSNLLQALSKLNSFDGAKYEINADWPIDLWGQKNAQQTVCTAKFRLEPPEIKDLYQSFLKPPPAPPPAKEGQPPPPPPSPTIAPPALPELDVIVSKGYENALGIRFEPGLPAEIDTEKAKQWIQGRLPKCVYMDDFATFSGHAELNPLLGRLKESGGDRKKLKPEEQTILITLELAALNPDDLVAKSGSEEGRSIRAFDTSAASLHLTRSFRHKWRQKAVKFNLRIDGPTFDVLVEDLGLEAFVPLERRSRGFQWFISFIWRFTYASKGEFANCILLLDEPGLHLHHAGHRDLLDFCEDLAKTNTVIYSTHLSTMLDLGYPERVRIVEVHDHHAVIMQSVVSNQREPMMVIEAALGLSGGMSGLLGSRQNLVVEGPQEVVILNKLSRVLQNSGEDSLSDRIFPMPAQGASKTPMYASFLWGNKFDGAVLLDSDGAGREARKKIKELTPRQEGFMDIPVLMLGDAIKSGQNETAIEDIFPVSFYLACVNDAYGTNLKESELPVDGSDKIVARVEAVLKARARISELDKSLVMKAMLTQFNNIRTAKDLPPGTHEKARLLVAKINEAFSGTN